MNFICDLNSEIKTIKMSFETFEEAKQAVGVADLVVAKSEYCDKNKKWLGYKFVEYRYKDCVQKCTAHVRINLKGAGDLQGRFVISANVIEHKGHCPNRNGGRPPFNPSVQSESGYISQGDEKNEPRSTVVINKPWGVLAGYVVWIIWM